MPFAHVKWFTIAALFLASSLILHHDVAPHAQAATGANSVPSGWVSRHIGEAVRFAYPADFVAVNDGGPYVIQAGGALMNHAQTVYHLVLGVIVDSHPQATVQSVSAQLRHMYRADTLITDQSTSYGRELSFAMPNHMTYTVYLLQTGHVVREIVINNEQSNPAYDGTIASFLQSVRTP